MIRRLFWLVLGAVLGVTGYCKAAAFARSLRLPLKVSGAPGGSPAGAAAPLTTTTN